MAFKGLQRVPLLKQEYHISKFRFQVKNEIVVDTKFAKSLTTLFCKSCRVFASSMADATAVLACYLSIH